MLTSKRQNNVIPLLKDDQTETNGKITVLLGLQRMNRKSFALSIVPCNETPVLRCKPSVIFCNTGFFFNIEYAGIYYVEARHNFIDGESKVYTKWPRSDDTLRTTFCYVRVWPSSAVIVLNHDKTVAFIVYEDVNKGKIIAEWTKDYCDVIVDTSTQGPWPKEMVKGDQLKLYM